MGQRYAPAAPYPGKDPVPIVQEAVWASGPVWRCAENLTSTGIRSPDRSARRQSLYRLRYPAPVSVCNFMKGVFVSVCPSQHPLGNSTSSVFITELVGSNNCCVVVVFCCCMYNCCVVVYIVVLYCSMYCLCVNVYCHRVTTQLQLTNIS